jgi:hypothetical protein
MNDENINNLKNNNFIEKVLFQKNQILRDEILLGETKIKCTSDRNEYANNDIIISNMLKAFIIESTNLRKKEIVIMC